MIELIILSFTTIYIINLVLKHNLFLSKLIFKIKFLGIHIEIDSKIKHIFLQFIEIMNTIKMKLLII